MTWKTEGVAASYFLIISMGINVAWISSPISTPLSVQHTAWENTSKIQLSTEGALPPFVEDAPKDNFSSDSGSDLAAPGPTPEVFSPPSPAVF